MFEQQQEIVSKTLEELKSSIQNLKLKMFNDLIYLGIIDGKDPVEQFTLESLWKTMYDFQNSKEIF
jgi:hypothetical protein